MFADEGEVLFAPGNAASQQAPLFRIRLRECDVCVSPFWMSFGQPRQQGGRTVLAAVLRPHSGHCWDARQGTEFTILKVEHDQYVDEENGEVFLYEAAVMVESCGDTSMEITSNRAIQVGADRCPCVFHQPAFWCGLPARMIAACWVTVSLQFGYGWFPSKDIRDF